MNRKDISYIGIFTEHIGSVLDKDIPNQHVTLAFAPTPEQLEKLLPYLGSEWEITPLGYGNNEKNEGLLVEIAPMVPYFGAEQKHITLSIGFDGKAVDTGTMEFGDHIPDEIKAKLPGKIVGQIAAFTRDRQLIHNPKEFQEYALSKEDTLSKAMIEKCQIDGKFPIYDRNLLRCDFNLISGSEKMIVTLDELHQLFANKTNLDGRSFDLEVVDPANGTVFVVNDLTDVAFQDGLLILMNEESIISNLYGLGEYVEMQRAQNITNQTQNQIGTENQNEMDGQILQERS